MFNVVILFNTVFKLKLKFKLKVDPNTCTFKKLKKICIPINFIFSIKLNLNK